MSYVHPPTNPFEYELYEADQLERERRMERERRHGEAIALYPHLKGAIEAADLAAEKLDADYVAWLEAELKRVKAEK